jgi:hypothetical protein
LRLAEAGKLFPPEVLQIEQLADLLSGAGRDYQSAW